MKSLSKKTILAMIIVIILLVGISSIGYKIGGNKRINKNTGEREELQSAIKKKTILEFDNRAIDTEGLIECDKKTIDINGDDVEDTVIMYGKTNDSPKYGDYIVVYDGVDEKILTTINLTPYMDIDIQNIMDIDGDDIKEIFTEYYSGGAGSGTRVYYYNNKTYNECSVDNNNINISAEILDGFKIKLRDSNSEDSYIINMTEEQKERYVREGNYYENGTKLDISDIITYTKPTGTNFIDIDKDGKLELLDSIQYVGKFDADSVLCEVKVYKYSKGKFVLTDFFAQAGEFAYNENYIGVGDEKIDGDILKKEEANKLERYSKFSDDEILSYIEDSVNLLMSYYTDRDFSDEKIIVENGNNAYYCPLLAPYNTKEKKLEQISEKCTKNVIEEYKTYKDTIIIDGKEYLATAGSPPPSLNIQAYNKIISRKIEGEYLVVELEYLDWFDEGVPTCSPVYLILENGKLKVDCTKGFPWEN